MRFYLLILLSSFLLFGCGPNEEDAKKVLATFKEALITGDEIQIQNLSTPEGYQSLTTRFGRKIRIPEAFPMIGKSLNHRSIHVLTIQKDRISIRLIEYYSTVGGHSPRTTLFFIKTFAFE